jgi:hypothetical protein
MKKSKRGQSLSFDAITATALFIALLIIAVIYYYNLNQSGIQNTLSRESVIISQNLLSTTQSDSGIIDGGTLDDKKLEEIMRRLLMSMDPEAEYQAIKVEMGIRDDFCIYIEDEDGNLLLLQMDQAGTPTLFPVIFGSDRAIYKISESTDQINCNDPRIPP